MRLFEFADAKEQLALWKLVSDAVWSSIKKQQSEQAEAEAYKASQSKPKIRSTRKASSPPKFKAPPQQNQQKKRNLQTKQSAQVNPYPKTQTNQAPQYPQKAASNTLQQPQTPQQIQRQLTTQKMRSRLDSPQIALGTTKPSSSTS
jgi:hypothetical protein